MPATKLETVIAGFRPAIPGVPHVLAALPTSAPPTPASPTSAPWRAPLRQAATALLTLAIVAALWQAATTYGAIRPSTLPRLTTILATLAATPTAYAAAILHTLAETLLGFAVGATVGIGAGILFHRAPTLRDMLFPLFIVSQTIPVIAFGALVVLWFGNTLAAKAVIAFYLTFFPVTVNTLAGLRTTNPHQVALLRSFGATPTTILRRLELPMAAPQIFVALRLGASLGLVGAIVGEWFGDTTGIGVLLLQSMFNEDTPGLWAAIFCAALLGMTLYAAVAALERRIVFWPHEAA